MCCRVCVHLIRCCVIVLIFRVNLSQCVLLFSKVPLWQWQQCTVLEIAPRPWLIPLWSWKVCANSSDLRGAAEGQKQSLKGWGCQTDLAEVQKDSISATKQASGNQFSQPKVMASRQLEQRQPGAFSCCETSTISTNTNPQQLYTGGKRFPKVYFYIANNVAQYIPYKEPLCFLMLCEISSVFRVIFNPKPTVPWFLITLKLSFSIRFDLYNGQQSSWSVETCLWCSLWFLSDDVRWRVKQHFLRRTCTTTDILGLSDSRLTHSWWPLISSVPFSHPQRLWILITHKVKR